MYKISPDGHERLCIPSALHQTLFKYVHDNQGHEGAGRVYDRLRLNVYMPKLKRLVEKYVTSCPICAVSKPGRHLP